jgi:hypothetical protein
MMVRRHLAYALIDYLAKEEETKKEERRNKK